MNPEFLSQFALWLAVIALSVLVTALARQVGLLHERIAPAGALALGRQIAVGEPGPAMDLVALDGSPVKIGGPRSGRSQLLFFVSPDCPVCKSLLPVVRSAAAAEKSWIDLVLASDGDPAAHKAMIAEQNLAGVPYVLSEQLGRQLAVSKLPYGVVLDEEGVIAAFGLINSREHLESLFEAKERGVASIQQYLSRRQSAGGRG
ncbi:MAG: methylamine dehydrogenase accessory protein MauD [Proteobacteria bacterium]|nr:methylamine dehydrogenase accessory protein MauD [Pseudomonadota bacterium]